MAKVYPFEIMDIVLDEDLADAIMFFTNFSSLSL